MIPITWHYGLPPLPGSSVAVHERNAELCLLSEEPARIQGGETGSHHHEFEIWSHPERAFANAEAPSRPGERTLPDTHAPFLPAGRHN
jgi:hypothetical protein